MAELDVMKVKLADTITENERNKQFTGTIKEIEGHVNLVEGYIGKLANDLTALKAYYDKLNVLKGRGFKVANALARLKCQIDNTNTSISNQLSQKQNRLVLLKNGILELTKAVLDYRGAIDDQGAGIVKNLKNELHAYDSIDERITISDVMKLAIISLPHLPSNSRSDPISRKKV